jgi:hypothetical protein
VGVNIGAAFQVNISKGELTVGNERFCRNTKYVCQIVVAKTDGALTAIFRSKGK